MNHQIFIQSRGLSTDYNWKDINNENPDSAYNLYSRISKFIKNNDEYQCLLLVYNQTTKNFVLLITGINSGNSDFRGRPIRVYFLYQTNEEVLIRNIIINYLENREFFTSNLINQLSFENDFSFKDYFEINKIIKVNYFEEQEKELDKNSGEEPNNAKKILKEINKDNIYELSNWLKGNLLKVNKLNFFDFILEKLLYKINIDDVLKEPLSLFIDKNQSEYIPFVIIAPALEINDISNLLKNSHFIITDPDFNKFRNLEY